MFRKGPLPAISNLGETYSAPGQIAELHWMRISEELSSQFGTSTENTPMPDCIRQLHRPEKEMMEDPQMMEVLKMHMMSAQIMGGMH